MKIYYDKTQKFLPRVSEGVDWGSGGRVLMRFRGFELVWRPGGSVYIDRHRGTAHASSLLMVHRPKKTPVVLARGGQLTELRITGQWPRIVNIMKLPRQVDPARIRRKHTLIVEK